MNKRQQRVALVMPAPVIHAPNAHRRLLSAIPFARRPLCTWRKPFFSCDKIRQGFFRLLSTKAHSQQAELSRGASRLLHINHIFMTSNSIDLPCLFDLPNEDFLPAVFRAIIRREPDVAGLMHYAKRLQNGSPRALVLAELRASAEGRSKAKEVISPELDRLTSRYLMVRSLPFKTWRWRLLQRANAKGPSDVAFHWERWASDYARNLNAPADKPSVSPMQKAQVPQPMIDPEKALLQRKLETLTGALQKTVYLLEANGAPRHAIQPLQDAVQSLLTTRPDSGTVSWEARQALQWFSHILPD